MLRRILLNKNFSKLIIDPKPYSALINRNVLALVINNSKRQLSTATSSDPNSSSSVDEREIRNFRQMADSWWIENGEYEPLHQLNLLRVPLVRDVMINYRNSLSKTERDNILTYTNEKKENKVYTQEELIREPLLGLNIIDIGCGGGLFSEPLARLGAQVTAIDACKENVIAAQMRVQSQQEKLGVENSKFYDRLRYINCTVEDLVAVEENFNYFDAIVCSEVVEHVNNLHEFISNSGKLLKVISFKSIITKNSNIWL